MTNLNDKLIRIEDKNRKAKLIILLLVVVFGIATFWNQTILETVLCFGFFLAMLFSNPYHYSIKKIKRQMEIKERLQDSLK